MKKVVVLLIAGLALNSCGNNENNLSTTQNSRQKNSNLTTSKFNLEELSQLIKGNADEFDSYVLKKGYRFEKKESFEKTECFIYSNLENKNNMILYYKFATDSPKTSCCVWSTNSKEDYLKLKEEIVENGFEYIDVKNPEHLEAPMLFYKKGNQFVDLDMKKHEDGILYSISTYLMKQ
jgi:hypothetical protein